MSEQYLKKANFHITCDSPKIKMRAILDTEGICPSCGGKHTAYMKCDSPYRHGAFQNSYTCNDCGTTWVGNTFDQNYDRVQIPVSSISKSSEQPEKHYNLLSIFSL